MFVDFFISFHILTSTGLNLADTEERSGAQKESSEFCYIPCLKLLLSASCHTVTVSTPQFWTNMMTCAVKGKQTPFLTSWGAN